MNTSRVQTMQTITVPTRSIPVLAEAGVRTLCHLAAIESVVADGRSRGVLVDTKLGRRAILGRIVIDATGDGDGAANAGVPFGVGRPEDGRIQGMTMMFRVRGVDAAVVRANPGAADRVLKLMQDLRAQGEFPPFMDLAADSYLHSPRGPDVSYNMCPAAGNPLDEEELTRLSVTARRQAVRYVELWRREMPGFAAARNGRPG